MTAVPVYWVAFKTILTKEILRFTRIWVQTVLPPAITMALYFVIFGKLIGSQIGDMEGFRYIDFIVPGLILMSVISNSYANVVSSFYSSKFQHNIVRNDYNQRRFSPDTAAVKPHRFFAVIVHRSHPGCFGDDVFDHLMIGFLIR